MMGFTLKSDIRPISWLNPSYELRTATPARAICSSSADCTPDTMFAISVARFVRAAVMDGCYRFFTIRVFG